MARARNVGVKPCGVAAGAAAVGSSEKACVGVIGPRGRHQLVIEKSISNLRVNVNPIFLLNRQCFIKDHFHRDIICN